jgi:CO/xanthine dehydrogenase Mo-binding subunit
MQKPTCEQLFDSDPAIFELVSRKTDDSWRHGCYVTAVYRRLADETFWSASYRLSSDGETNELREGHAAIAQVTPRSVTQIVYDPVIPC